jgi:hypothetical protein
VANNIAIKDGAGESVTLKSTDSAGVQTPHHNVDTLPALPAGSNIIGNVRIDQTTPGTTNGVQVAAALPAGTNLLGKVGTDQTTHGTTDKVAADLYVGGAAAAAAVPVPVQSPGFVSAATVTKTNSADAYAALDVIGEGAGAANMSFANIGGIAGGHVMITGASIRVDKAAVAAGMETMRVHLYDAAPTAIADNAAYNLPSGDRAKYLGYITIPTAVDLGDTLYSRVDNLGLKVKLAAASTTLYGILQTVGAFTPANEATVRTVTLNGVQC